LVSGIERSVAATKTYSGSLALFALLSVALNENDRQRANELSQVSMHMTLALELNDSARAIAETYKDVSECVTLARGYNQATAQETALKLIETSYIGARAYSAADFQHGPVAQLENGLPCLLFAPEGRTFASMLQFTEKLHAKHTNLICIGHDQSFLNLGRASLAISEIVPEWLSPLVYIIPAQLLAYHLAVARGSNPDAPRSLNKVTQTT
jgi:glucosamine--fructose-6-phosphate aminotransferase (isomerizing)